VHVTRIHPFSHAHTQMWQLIQVLVGEVYVASGNCVNGFLEINYGDPWLSITKTNIKTHSV